MNTTIDPITLEIMRNAFQSIADEMTASLVRTAYSPNIKDRMDCSSAILTTDGEVIAQTELGTPFHMATIPAAAEMILKRYPIAELHPGDAVVCNLPYPIGPGHLSDVTLLSPVYRDDRAVALVANMAHHVDMGGYAPGSMPFNVSEIYQEGLQIPPVKLVKRGRVDTEILSFIIQNIRTQTETRGDLMAQVAANNVGARRINELISRSGTEHVLAHMAELLDYAERSMRSGIRRIPEGHYTFEDYVEGDGFSEDLVKIRVSIDVGADAIKVDFTGTDKQVRGPMNARISAARACVYYALKCIIDPELPTNHGAYRPISVEAEEGSLVQAIFPAAVCNANILTDQRLVDVVLGALLEAVPHRVVAACSGEMNLVNLGGINPATGIYYNYVETYGGGQGAMQSQDGMDGVHTHMTNTRNTPVEVIEASYPFRVERYGLVPDSDGAGKYRGGLGMTREILLMGEEATFSLSADRKNVAPWGVFGGRDAGRSSCIIVSKDGKKRRLPSKITTRVVEGDRIVVVTPGGGGWGPPEERNRAAIERDIREGFISRRRAREVYGYRRSES